MAYSFWVMFQEKRLPPVARLAAAIVESEFPLSIDSDWEWRSHSGWLPMHWHGKESGCEVGFEPLDQSDIVSAQVEGYDNLDSVVVITTRGWDSLRVAYAFAACLVKMTGGCISEDDDEFLAAKDAQDWARGGIEAAQQRGRDEESRAATSDEIRDDLDGYLKSLLAKLVGLNITRFSLINNSLLAMHTEDGPSVSSSVWTLQTPDSIYDVTRFARVKDREDDVLFGLDSTPEDRQLLENDLDQADQQDEEDKSVAWPLLEKWADDAAIVEAQWLPPHTVEVTLSIDGNPKLIFSGEGYLANVIVREGLTEVHIGTNGLQLYEIKPG